MPEELNFIFALHYDSNRTATIVYNSLLPETILEDFTRSHVSLSLSNNKIILKISAKDMTAAKASIHSSLRWISTSSNIIKTLSEFEVAKET